MRLRFITSTLLLAFAGLLAMGNRNGRAASQNRGNTGAPGDEVLSGQPRTCASCHGGGITAALAIAVLDAAGNSVTQYVPGKSYQAKVTITATGTGLSGYGFQMIALRNNGNVDLDGFSDPGNNNYKIATISNGRTYAEHDNVSNSNTFTVPWKAPVAGTGSVTFYSAGNGVNRDNNSGGDGAASAKLVLTESGTVSSNDLSESFSHFDISPNPTRSLVQINLATLETGAYQLAIYGATGHIFWFRKLSLDAAEATALTLDASEWPAGVYIAHLSNGQGSLSKKMILFK